MDVRVCVALVALAGAVRAEEPAANGPEKVRKPPLAVIDGAGLFKTEAKQRAQEIADQIREGFGIDVCVETVKEVPGLDEHARLAKQREFLHEKAQDRADEWGVEGLYVLVLKDESRLLVTVVPWPAWRSQHPYTSRYKRYRLQKYLERELRNNPDVALVTALDQFRLRLVQSRELGESPLPALPALALLGGLVGFWLLVRVGRGRVTARPGPLYQPAVQGSLFGVPAGFWVYDRLFQAERERLSAAGALTPSTPAPEPHEPHEESPPPGNDPTTGTPV